MLARLALILTLSCLCTAAALALMAAADLLRFFSPGLTAWGLICLFVVAWAWALRATAGERL